MRMRLILVTLVVISVSMWLLSQFEGSEAAGPDTTVTQQTFTTDERATNGPDLTSESWVLGYKLGGDEWLDDMTITTDGNLILTGNGWSMKLDSNGAVLWADTTATFREINAAADGGFAGSYSITNVAKFDGENNPEWLTIVEPEIGYPFLGVNVLPIQDGSYIVSSNSPSCSHTACTPGIPWIIKLDATGQFDWAKYYNPAVESFEIQYETADQGYLAYLWPNEIAKFRADGTNLWTKTYSRSVASVEPTTDNGHLLAGFGYWFEDPACWVMKTHSDGSVDWEKIYDSDSFQGDDRVAVAYETGDGNYLLLCSTGESFTLLKLDTNGEIIWQKQYGEGILAGSYAGPYLQVAADNSIYVGTNITNSLGLDGGGLVVWKLKPDGTIDNCSLGQPGAVTEDTGFIPTTASSSEMPIGGNLESFVRREIPPIPSSLEVNATRICPWKDEVTAVISPAGGSLTSTDGNTQFLFPAGTFSDTVQVTYHHFWDDETTGDLVGIGHRFELNAVYSATNQPAQLYPGATYTGTVHYTDTNSAIETTVGLYARQETGWQLEMSSQLSLPDNLVRGEPNQLGQFALLGETNWTYLPNVWHDKNIHDIRLVLHLDEPTNATQFEDSSGHAHHGQCTGESCPTAGVPGMRGTAVQFDGLHDTISLGNPIDLQTIRPEISIAAWVKPASGNGIQNILAHGYSLQPQGETFLRINNGRYQIGSWDGTDHVASFEMPGADIGQWVYLVGVYDGTSWRLYRNGVEVSSSSDETGAMFVYEDWAVGATGNGDGRFFQGSIDEIAVYNRGLSSAEVLQLYQTYTNP